MRPFFLPPLSSHLHYTRLEGISNVTRNREGTKLNCLFFPLPSNKSNHTLYIHRPKAKRQKTSYHKSPCFRIFFFGSRGSNFWGRKSRDKTPVMMIIHGSTRRQTGLYDCPDFFPNGDCQAIPLLVQVECKATIVEVGRPSPGCCCAPMRNVFHADSTARAPPTSTMLSPPLS